MFIRSFSSSFWDWVRLWPLADPTHLAVGSNWSAIDPREVYGLTSAFSTDWQARLGGQANRVTSGQVLREKRGMGAGEHVSSPHVMCMCQSRPFFSSRFLHFFSGAALFGSLSSNFACPNDAWRRQTADPRSLLLNRLYPAYCMSITCFFFLTQFIIFFPFSFRTMRS